MLISFLLSKADSENECANANPTHPSKSCRLRRHGCERGIWLRSVHCDVVERVDSGAKCIKICRKDRRKGDTKNLGGDVVQAACREAVIALP